MSTKKFKRWMALIVVVTVGAGVVSGSASASNASRRSAATPYTWRNCGIVTCTDYMTRSETVAKANFIAAHGVQMYELTHEACTSLEVLDLFVSPNLVSAALWQLGCYLVTQRLASQMITVQRAAAWGGCFEISFLRYGSNNPFFATGWGIAYGSYWCRP